MIVFCVVFKVYCMYQVLIMFCFVWFIIVFGLVIVVFFVDVEYYFNLWFLSNDFVEFVDLFVFIKGCEVLFGIYWVDIYLNDEFMISWDIIFIVDDNNVEFILCLSIDFFVSFGIKKQCYQIIKNIWQKNMCWIIVYVYYFRIVWLMY